MEKKELHFAFFGTDEFAVGALEELAHAGHTPELIVSTPDTKQGRGMKLTPPPAKTWAGKHNLKCLQPEKLDDNFRFQISDFKFDFFIVASYGKIIPKEILDIPAHGALNVHPSLLPAFRGPSPIQSQILCGVQETGVTIIKMDEKIDHGPVLARRVLEFPISNFQFPKLRDALAHLGGKLLAETIPKWISGEIAPCAQDHNKATYTKKITKEDGRIDMKDAPELNYRKFLAHTPRPGVFFLEKGKRIKITDAEFENGTFTIMRVIPEGKKEVDYTNFARQ